MKFAKNVITASTSGLPSGNQKARFLFMQKMFCGKGTVELEAVWVQLLAVLHRPYYKTHTYGK